jgi:hypothetical protein
MPPWPLVDLGPGMMNGAWLARRSRKPSTTAAGRKTTASLQQQTCLPVYLQYWNQEASYVHTDLQSSIF